MRGENSDIQDFLKELSSRMGAGGVSVAEAENAAKRFLEYERFINIAFEQAGLNSRISCLFSIGSDKLIFKYNGAFLEEIKLRSEMIKNIFAEVIPEKDRL